MPKRNQGDTPPVSRGPYGEYLKRLRERAGDRGWDLLQDLPAPVADAWIRRIYVPFEWSKEAWVAAQSIRAGKDPVIWEVALEERRPTVIAPPPIFRLPRSPRSQE